MSFVTSLLAMKSYRNASITTITTLSTNDLPELISLSGIHENIRKFYKLKIIDFEYNRVTF